MMNELLWALMLLINFIAIVIAYRLWGKTGLYIWIPIAAIVANIQVTKTVDLFGFTATLGNIVYAGSFLVTDILSENHGKKEAKRAVGIGFFSLIAMTFLMSLALLFQPHSSDFAHESLVTLFAPMPRIVMASLIAYGLSQLHDIWSYNFWKLRWPAKKYIWVRNNLSTMVSQLIDSVVFTLVAFYGVFPTAVLLEIVITTYLFKWIVAILDTPFLYLASNWNDKSKIPASM
jgi:queuosine precursor transporter